MNLTLRKIILLEKHIIKIEEYIKIMGYTTSPIDAELKNRITNLIDQVRNV